MRSFFRARQAVALASLALASLFVGCGGSETVTIQFPEGAPVPQTTPSAPQKASSQSSQGDPSQYSR